MRTLHIQRALKNARLVYSFQGTQLSGQARCTGGFLLQKLSVQRADGVPGTWILAQKNWLLRLLACLPLLRLVIRVPFRLTHDGCLCGSLRYDREARASVLQCGTARYTLRLHSHRTCSVCRGERQIAKFQRSAETWMERRQYTLCIDDSVAAQELPLLALLCMFADTAFYRKHGRLSMYEKETDWVIHDPAPEMADWMPQ